MARPAAYAVRKYQKQKCLPEQVSRYFDHQSGLGSVKIERLAGIAALGAGCPSAWMIKQTSMRFSRGKKAECEHPLSC